MVKDKKASEFATRDYTIHLSKRLYGVTFKKRAPRAVREVKKFAQQMMKTRYVSFRPFHRRNYGEINGSQPMEVAVQNIADNQLCIACVGHLVCGNLRDYLYF